MEARSTLLSLASSQNSSSLLSRRLRDMAWLPLFDGFLLDSFHSVAWEWPAVEGTPWKHAFFLEPFQAPDRKDRK